MYGPWDEMEALGYMLVKLNCGSLPWGHARSQEELQRIKAATPLDKLCAHSPSSVRELLQWARHASFGDAVDYDALARLFEPALRRATFRVRGDHSADERKVSSRGAPSAPALTAVHHHDGRSRPRSKSRRALKKSRSRSMSTANQHVQKKAKKKKKKKKKSKSPARRARVRARVRSTTPGVRRSKRLAAKPAVRYC